MLQNSGLVLTIRYIKYVNKFTYLYQMKNIAFTSEQREQIIDMALGWYADWKHDEPTVYTETVEERRQLMLPLNNSQLIKHLQEFYAPDIWDFINY